MSEHSKDLRVAFPGDDGIGASFNRELDAWVLYTTPKCERFGQIDGYNPKRIDAVLMALRAAFKPAPPETTDNCQGWQSIETAPKDGTQIIGRTTQEQVFACNWFWDDEEKTEGDWLEHGTDVVRPREWLAYPASSASGDQP